MKRPRRNLGQDAQTLRPLLRVRGQHEPVDHRARLPGLQLNAANAFGQIQSGGRLRSFELQRLPLPVARGPQKPGGRRHDGPLFANHLERKMRHVPASADRTRAQSQ